MPTHDHDTRSEQQQYHHQLIGEYLRATFAICDAHQVPRDSALAAAIYQTVSSGHADVPLVESGHVIHTPASLDEPDAQQRLAAQIDQAIASGARRIVLDCSETAHVGGAGLGALLSAARRARVAGASVTVTNPSEELRTLLQVTQLGSIVGVGEPRGVPARPAGE